MRTRLSFSTVLAIYLTAYAVPAKAQHIRLHAEPNRNVIGVDYKKESDTLFGQIEALYFAIGCKVVPSEASLAPYIQSISQAFKARMRESGIHSDETNNMKQAASKGMARANGIGACEFWRQHPEMAKELRKVAASGY